MKNSKVTSKNVSTGSFNDLTEQGFYFVTPAVTDAPISGSNYWRVRVEVYSGAQCQYANISGATDIYFRYRANNTWGTWSKQPTRTEMDAVKSKNLTGLAIETSVSGVNQCATILDYITDNLGYGAYCGVVGVVGVGRFAIVGGFQNSDLKSGSFIISGGNVLFNVSVKNLKSYDIWKVDLTAVSG